MKSSAAAWLVLSCLLPLGCSDDPKIELPTQTTRDPATDGTDAEQRVADCDQAADGTPCGLEKHCLFNACVANACGDGIAAAREACDDGNERDHDGCDARCRLEVPPGCGNGVEEPGEECDDEKESLTCTASCTRPVCGDKILSAGEECDDGNASNLDRCDSTCMITTMDAAVGPADAGSPELDAGLSIDAGTGSIEVDAGWVSSEDAGAPDAGSSVDAGPRPPFGIAHEVAACKACRDEQCTTYQGLIDAVAACFSNGDPTFVQECVDVMDCAYTHDCGYNVTGLTECFCGSADVSACQTPGTADGPCRSEIYAAAHTTQLAEVISRFGDVSLPIGAANYLQECDQTLCAACRP